MAVPRTWKEMELIGMILARAPGTLVQPWDLWRTNCDRLCKPNAMFNAYGRPKVNTGVCLPGALVQSPWHLGTFGGPIVTFSKTDDSRAMDNKIQHILDENLNVLEEDGIG